MEVDRRAKPLTASIASSPLLEQLNGRVDVLRHRVVHLFYYGGDDAVEMTFHRAGSLLYEFQPASDDQLYHRIACVIT